MTSTSDCLSLLRLDPWRTKVGFSPEIEQVNNRLFQQGLNTKTVEELISQWLQRHQPCLFGRLGAQMGLIEYCILYESDLEKSDAEIRDKIQKARLKWARAGYEGRKSGFIILIISKKIAYSLPDEHMLKLARRLCSLYLLEEISSDGIHLDEIYLEIPGSTHATWKWSAGVNYFCSQGDKRWWQDHRIPGGMAFSINSVGHMVKSGKLVNAMQELETLLDLETEKAFNPKIDSLEKALEFAMRTIALAADGISGRATELLSLPIDIKTLPVQKCPIDLPHALSDKNFCTYQGYYNTDYTLPSEYFMPDIERSDWVKKHELDFTYLFQKELENFDYNKMGSGIRVRSLTDISHKSTITPKSRLNEKRKKGTKTEIPIDQCPVLLEALEQKL